MKVSTRYIALILCGFLSCANAQDNPPAQIDKLTSRVILGQSKILPYEAVSALASLNNETRQPIDRVGYSRYDAFGFIDYMGVATFSEQNPVEGWNSFTSSSRTGSPPPGPPQHHIFAPGEIYHYFTWIGADFREQHPFSQPGRYRVRSGGNFDAEVEQTLQVLEPTGEDAEALSDLEAQKLYICFTSDSIRENFDTADSAPRYNALLEAFALKHPRSRYAQWARWGQMLIRTQFEIWNWPHLRGGITAENLATNQEYQRAYEQLAPQLFPFLRANAWYRAGILALITGDVVKGNSLLNQAIALNADPTLPRQVALIHQQIEKYPKLIYQPPAPKGEDHFQRVEEQLTAERYDIKGLEKLQKVRVEYSSKLLQLNAQRRKGEITEDEFNQAGAKLFDSYIRTYTEPLSPEAWKALQEQRNNESNPKK